MTLKKFLEEKRRRRRRDFLVGAGTLVALPFLESLYCNNLYAQNQAPLRVLFGMIWPGVDQVAGSYAPDSTLNVLNDISEYTVFHRGVDTKSGGAHPDYCQRYGFGDGRNSFNVHAANIAKQGSLPGLLNVGFDHQASFGGYRFLKKNGANLNLLHGDFNKIVREAINVQNNGVVTDPNTGQPMIVQLPKKTRLKKLSLDYVVDSIKDLQRKLSPSDKRLLDEHLTQIESIEKRLPRDPSSDPQSVPEKPPQENACKGVQVGNNLNWLQKHDLMVDIIAQSFICDSRRVISIISNNCREHVPYQNWPDRFPNFKKLMDLIKSQRVTDRAGAENDTKPDYHLTTHFIQGGKGNAKMRNAIQSQVGGNPEEFLRNVRRDIDKFNVNFYGRVARKLRNTLDTNGKTVLENSLIYFGGHMADATRHSSKNLFSCTIGRGRGKINTSSKFNDHNGKNVTNFQMELINKLKG